MKDKTKILLTSILAIGGTIGTAVTGIKAGKKLERDKYKMSLREKIKTYIPPIACCTGTIVFVLCNYRVSKKAIDAMNSLYSAALLPLIDPRKGRPPIERTIRPFENDFIDSPDEPVLFYDSFANRYFEARTCDVLWAEKEIDRMFAIGCMPCLNDFYDLLGLKRTEDGKIGWTPYDGDYYWIDFYHVKTKTDDGLECYILDAVQTPVDGILEDYCRW